CATQPPSDASGLSAAALSSIKLAHRTRNAIRKPEPAYRSSRPSANCCSHGFGAGFPRASWSARELQSQTEHDRPRGINVLLRTPPSRSLRFTTPRQILPHHDDRLMSTTEHG